MRGGARHAGGGQPLVRTRQIQLPLGLVLPWRWLTGHPLGGAEQGAATGRRRLRRVGWRHGLTLAAVAALVLGIADPAAFLAVAAAGLADGGWLAVLWWRQHPHHRDYLRTTYDRWRSHGVPLEHGADWHLEIPEDRSWAKIWLESGWDAPTGTLELAEKSTARTLGWGEGPVVTRNLTGRRRSVLLEPPPLPPPGSVVLANPKIQEAIRKAAPWEIIAGLGRAEAVVKYKMMGSNARPHGLLNGPTLEAGKSSTARWINAQWLRHGGISIILDPAWLSHPWASTFTDGNLPNVIVVRQLEDIAAVLIWLGETMDNRLKVALAGQRRSGLVEAEIGVPILVTLEEMNSLILDLKDYPEAVEALVKLVCRGRHMLIHALCLSQRAEARTLAGKYGGQVREQLGWAFLGRGTTPKTLKFLAEGLPFPPGGITGPEGRYGAVIGREWVDVQMVFATNEECWDLARSRPDSIGKLPHDIPEFMGSDLVSVTGTGGTALQPGNTQPPPVPVTAGGPPPEPLASLQEYAVLRELSWTALHKRRARWRGRGWPEVADHDDRNSAAELFVIRELDEHLRDMGVLG